LKLSDSVFLNSMVDVELNSILFEGLIAELLNDLFLVFLLLLSRVLLNIDLL
jgi:hypothetical protein